MADRALSWLQVGALIALFASLLCGAFGYFLFQHSNRMNAWSEAQGTILSSDVALKPMRSSSQGSEAALHLHWTLLVQYSFEVNGKTYGGDRPSSRRIMDSTEGGSAPPQWLEAERARFRPGASVIVHYDPQAPQRSVLQVDNSQPRLLLIIASVAATISLLLFALRFFTKGN